MIFQPGDKVRFLNQKGGGIIKKIISPQMVSVEIEDGFEIPTLTSELIKVDASGNVSRVFWLESQAIALNPLQPEGEERNTSQEPASSRVFSLRKDPAPTMQAIWLAFIPFDQKWLISGNMEVCLLNNTMYDVLYSLSLRSTQGYWQGFDYDVIPPFSGIELHHCRREELELWKDGIIQLLLHSEIQSHVLPPIHATFRIRSGRFMKEDNYIETPLLSKRMVMIKLADILPNSEPGPNDGKTDEVTETQTRQVDRSQALIDKHRIGPGEAEVDLHISALTDQYAHLTKHEILKMQVDYFRRALDSAFVHQYRKVIFIHGIGNGTLRDTLLQILREYEDVTVRSAPFQTYGYGAIELLLPRE